VDARGERMKCTAIEQEYGGCHGRTWGSSINESVTSGVRGEAGLA
jgi:hypothetical protein